MGNSIAVKQGRARVAQDGAGQFGSGVALAIGGTLLFALKSILIKLAFSAGARPMSLLTIRMAFSLPFYVAMLVYLSRNQEYRPARAADLLRAFALGFLGYYLASFLDLCGLELITAQLERLTLFTYPAIIAVLAWMFLGEELNGRIVSAIVLCYAGVLAMYLREKSLVTGSNVGLGVILVMGSAVSYSLYVVIAKPTMQKLGSREFTSYAMIGSTFFACVHCLASQSVPSLLELSPAVFLYGLVLAFACTVIPSFMINEAILRLGATRTTLIGSAGPVFTMVLAIGFLHEPFSLQHLLGMLLVLLGVGLVARR